DSYQISGLTGKVGANGTAMSGGTKRTVTVVSQDDIDKAKTGLKDNNDAAGKRDLIKSFGDDYIAIEDSFTIDVQDPKSDPDIDKETTTTSATLTATTVYSGYGVNKSQVSKFLDAQAKDSIKNQADQKIYKNGLSGVSFEDFVGDSGKRSANIRATAQTGPNISEDDVKNAAKGQKYGEVKRLIGSINGVRDVDVKFSFFWVSTVPNDTSRIKVEFQLND
ncbi:hypothetical protein FWF48_03735, partial [Candidatus Saccharibacteria bacterium]|nr:hypothetical protein [Candidatus Saccharibacteria bacterium]